MNEESNQRKSGVVLSYVSIIASTLVQLLYTPFLLRMLGEGEYGLYSLTASIIGYLTVLDLGFGNAIVVYTAKYRANKEYKKEQKMQGMFKIIFYVIGFIIALLGIALYFNVDNLFGKTMTEIELEKTKIMMLILTINLIITFSFNIYSSIINAYERFTFHKIMSILNTLLKPLIMIPLLFMGYKSIGMCVAITIVNLIIVLSNYFYCQKKLKIKVKYKGFDKKLFFEMFGYSFFIFLGVVVDKVNWSVDQFILGIVCGTTAVSIYTIASQLNQLFINLSTAISGVLLPKMSKMVAKKATGKELTSEMIKVGRLQYFIIFLMVTGLIFFGKEFILWWAGNNYENSYYIALILIIPLCFPLIQNLGLSIMQAMSKYKFRAISSFIMALFNIIISYFLAQKYGPIGTAIGTAISLIFCNIFLMNIYYKKVIKLDVIEFWKNILKMSFTFIPSILIIGLIMHFMVLNGIKGVIIYSILYTLIYSLNAYFITMNSYEKNLVNNTINKLTIRIRKQKEEE